MEMLACNSTMDSCSYSECEFASDIRSLFVCVCVQSENSQGKKPLLGCSSAAKHIEVPYIHSTADVFK